MAVMLVKEEHVSTVEHKNSARVGGGAGGDDAAPLGL
jgi:hypothetical protein